MKTKRLVSLFLALVLAVSMLATLAVSSSAANAQMLIGMSSRACTANLSSASMPEWEVPSQGDTYYINFASTVDYKFSRADFYVKAPGQSSFSCIYTFNPSGYFRWVNCAYTFAQSGTYTVRVVVTMTNGTQCSGDMSFDVAAKASYSAPPSTGYTYWYNGSCFNVVPNLKSSYCYNQYNYPRFKNSSGFNGGCTATAMCTAYSIYHNSTFSPNSARWNSGTYWEKCIYYSENGRTYRGTTFSQAEALKAIWNSTLNYGRPLILYVGGLRVDHVVTAVGVKQSANWNSLKMSDILIVDPAGGSICTLDKYSCVDCLGGLRVPA